MEIKGNLILKNQPDGRDLHVNRPLTNISLALFQAQERFIADKVFPQIPVSKRSDLYSVYPRGMFNRNEMAKRAPGTETMGVNYSVSTDNYFAHVWGLHVDIADQDRENADDQFDLDREATELLTIKALINRESEWVSAFWALSKWATDLTGIASSPSATQFIFWNDYAASNPLLDVEKGMKLQIERGAPEPNTLVLDRATWGALKNHPVILDRINRGQTSGPAKVQLESVASLMELDRILVGRGVSNTAIEGAADVHSFLMGDNALLCYVPPSPGRYVPAAGYTFSWRGFSGANAAGTRMSRLRMEHLRSDRIEIESAYAQKLVSADCGIFYSNTLA